MNSDQRNNTIDDAQLALIDGSTDTDHTAALSDSGDPAARARYFDLVAMQVLLVEHLEKANATAPADEPEAIVEPASNIAWRWPIAIVAAAVLIAGAALTVALVSFDTDPTPDAPQQPAPPVATLIDSTGIVMMDNDIANPGDDYAAGAYSVESGSAELQLFNGANVQTHGRARLRVHGETRLAMRQGTARFNCPPSAHGFAVDLPGGHRVVDLGTGFVIHVEDDGTSRVIVTEGVVRLDTTIDDAPVAMLLTAGESIDIHGDQAPPALTDIRETPRHRALVARWTFDDAHRLGHEAVEATEPLRVQGDAKFSPDGRSGGALALDGNGDALTASVFPEDLPVGDDAYTVAAWIKPVSTGARGIVGWGAYGIIGHVNALRLRDANGLSHYWWAGRKGSDLIVDDASVPLTSSEWIHVAVTYDGTTRRMFVNGKLIAHDTPSAPEVAAKNFTVGVTNNHEYFHGLIDDIAIYNTALDASEIDSEMNKNPDH